MFVWSWAFTCQKDLSERRCINLLFVWNVLLLHWNTYLSDNLFSYNTDYSFLLNSSVQVTSFFHWAREVTLLYRLAWKCALYPLPAKKVYRTYCIPLCSWNQEEEGILAEQLLLGFVGLEGIRESLMEAADPGPAEQERENQTWNFF